MEWKDPSDSGSENHFVQWTASGSGKLSPYILRKTLVISVL